MAITNLTNYKWVSNTDISITIEKTYNFNGAYYFNNNTQYGNLVGLQFIPFVAGEHPPFLKVVQEGGSKSTVYSGGWSGEAPLTIEITGGTDATNTELIAWLEANGTLEKMVEPITQLAPFLTNIANAIRTKKGTTEPINAQNFATEIASIETGGGSSTPSDYTYVEGDTLYITKSTASLPTPLIVEKNFADGEEMTIDGVVKYRFNFTESEWNNLLQNKAVLYVKMGNDTDGASSFIVFTKTYQVRNNTTDSYYYMLFTCLIDKNTVHTFSINNTDSACYGELVIDSGR